MGRYDFAITKVGQLLDDPEAVAVIERRYPGLTRQPMVALMKGMPAEKAFGMAAATVGRRADGLDRNDALPGHQRGPISGKRKGLPASAFDRPMAPQKISVAWQHVK